MATMEENIKETPERIKGIVEARKEIFKEVVKPEYTRVVISGSGSSYHAGVGAQEFMLKYMQIPVEVLYPFQVEDYIFSEPETTLFIGVSQSGTSLSAYRAMKRAKEHGCRLASMSGRNDKAVVLNEVADDILTVRCGEEGDLQPKTKGMICTIVNLMMLGLEWGHAHGKISEDTYENAVSELVQTADNMPVIIQDADTWIQKNGEIMAKAHDIRVVGTKDIFGIVLEGSLKLVETLRVPVSGYEFEEFIHGIYNAINEDSVVILLDTGIEERVPTMKKILSQWSDYIIISGQSAQDEIDFKVQSAKNADYSVLEYILWIFMICEKVSAMKGIDIQTTKDTSFHAKLGSKKLR